MVYLGRTRKVHFVGIGGIGMSGIAEVLLNLGFDVSGSDIKESDITRILEDMGAAIMYGHAKDNVQGADVVVYSSAVSTTNPELIEAGRLTIPAIPRIEMLAELMRMKFAVTLSGAHGKTSTTSMVACVLSHGGLDPTVVVGGRLRVTSRNTMLGKSRYIVAEADESDGEFVRLPSTIAVITNIDLEHLDHYPDLDAIKNAFVQYANKVPFYGSVILCADDPNVSSIMPKIRRRKITYSLGQNADIAGRIISRNSSRTDFDVSIMQKNAGRASIRIPGDHYVRNALAAIAVGLELEIPFEKIQEGLELFEGVSRRFELKGDFNGIMIVDDYAHHPTEIEATIQAAAANFGKRIIVLFQPHRYSRTQAMADKFGLCFDGASLVLITDIYAAGEQPIPGVSSALIVDSIKASSNVPVSYEHSFEEMSAAVLNVAKKGDMIITMGAGDIFKAGELLAEKLKK